MRLFIAIELPKEIKDYLFTIKDKFSKDLAKINWTAKKNLHLTLKFLGEVNEKSIDDIINQLKKIKFSEFILELDGFGLFPNERKINVIWVGIKDYVKVMELQQNIEDNLRNIFEKEKEFSCHITLGRVKLIKDKNKFLQTAKYININPSQFKVKNFTLFKSELSKDGSKYTNLVHFNAINLKR